MRTFRLLAAVLTVLPVFLSACGGEREAPDPERFPLIPLPKEVEPGRGEFILSPQTGILISPASDRELSDLVERWADPIRQASGLSLPVVARGAESAGDVIRITLKLSGTDGAAVPPGEGLPGTSAEAYELEVTRKGIELEAPGRAGVFYGLETLQELIPGMRAATHDALDPWSVPAVEIEDAPRFPYRGMHLDVGRHFFPVSFIKRYIDLLATYKMNAFHWHLTEDQGWRLEIRGFPRLTEVGSCRSETMVEKNFDPYVGDGTPYCGFYTQEEAREIVAYARERFITVIPEIEMPGHSVAALAAYPELACTPGPFQVYTRWGVTQDIYCPKEETFAFLEDVLGEVMDIFPSPYIHIGGDEAPKGRWEESEFAQEVIQQEGLADEEELQSWFIRRIERFLNGRGRRIIGWDEILEGGLAPDATVMSWRGMAGGTDAARQGHDVIMTPNSNLYLDYYQGDTIQEPLAIGGYSPLEAVYAFEPIPPDLSPSEATHVLGAQGNVWTEYISTPDHVEYMVIPRMLALSEVVWTPRDRRSWTTFVGRLPAHLSRLGSQGIHFRIPDVLGLEEDVVTLADSAWVRLRAPLLDARIHYTLDGTDPGPASPQYDGPFQIPVDEAGTEVAARIILPDGSAGAFRKARFRRTHLMAPVAVPLSDRRPGLAIEAYTGRFRSVDRITGGDPLPMDETPSQPKGASLPRVTLPARPPAGGYGLVLSGFVRVPRKGIYTFILSSDDGSRLTVGHRIVVDHDGPHGMSEAEGKVGLHRGWHPFEVRYFQSGGDSGLKLEIEGPGLSRREVPAGWLAQLPEEAGE